MLKPKSIIYNKIASVDNVMIETKPLIILVNVANWHKKSVRLDTTRWGMSSTGYCARSSNLIILTNGRWTIRIRRIKFSVLFYLFFFCDTNRSPNPERRLDLMIIEKTKRELIVLWILSADHKEKTIESENRENYLDLARELRKLWDSSSQL